MITQEKLREIIEYKNGHLYWIVSPSPSVKAGTRFGTNSAGYIKGYIFKHRYYEHRLVWLYHYGSLPLKIIDHINGIKNDNRIENLRESNSRLNQWNRFDTRTSLYPGVSLIKSTGKWMSKVQVNKTQKYLGSFDSEIDAYKAYLKVISLIPS